LAGLVLQWIGVDHGGLTNAGLMMLALAAIAGR